MHVLKWLSAKWSAYHQRMISATSGNGFARRLVILTNLWQEQKEMRHRSNSFCSIGTQVSSNWVIVETYQKHFSWAWLYMLPKCYKNTSFWLGIFWRTAVQSDIRTCWCSAWNTIFPETPFIRWPRKAVLSIIWSEILFVLWCTHSVTQCRKIILN